MARRRPGWDDIVWFAASGVASPFSLSIIGELGERRLISRYGGEEQSLSGQSYSATQKKLFGDKLMKSATTCIR